MFLYLNVVEVVWEQDTVDLFLFFGPYSLNDLFVGCFSLFLQPKTNLRLGSVPAVAVYPLATIHLFTIGIVLRDMKEDSMYNSQLSCHLIIMIAFSLMCLL